MKFTINGKTLKSELECAMRVIERKSTIPICSNVLIVADMGQVTLTGTNLDQTIITPVAHNANEHFIPGAACVNAKTLSDMTKTLKNDILFEVVGEELIVSSGSITVKLPTVSRDQFPETPNVPGPIALTLDGDTLRSMVKDCSMAITTEQSRFTLAGGKLESDGDGSRLITTDGHRLAYTSVATPGLIDVIIPAKALTEAARMANCTVDIAYHNDHIRCNARNE